MVNSLGQVLTYARQPARARSRGRGAPARSRAMLHVCRSRSSGAQLICVPRSDPAAAVPRERAIARLRTTLGNVMSIVGSEARARQVRRAHHPRGSFLACAASDGAGAIASSRLERHLLMISS